MKHIFTSFILLFTLFMAPAQEMNLVFNDNFNDNRYSWDTYNFRDAMLTISNGEYYFEHKRRVGAWTTSKNIPLDFSKNFVIETKITKLYGINNHGYGLMWGSRDSRNHFVFLISGDGNFQIGQAINGKYYHIQKWKKSVFLKKWNHSNTLKIEKKQDKMLFYLNNRHVATTDFKAFYGPKIGFFINRNMRIKIDYIRVLSSEPSPYVEISEKDNQADNRHQDYPPDLYIEEVSLIEPSKNDALDADENGEIQFKILNKGKGKSGNIQIKITPLSSDENLVFQPSTTIAGLNPKSYRNISIPVSAEIEAESLFRKLRIELLEGNGFDSDPVILSFETQSLKKPDLQIKQVAINDKTDPSGGGDAYGNGNSVIEPGESVEVTAYVQNFGKGNAENVTAEVILNTENTHISYPDQGHVYQLGNIPPGDYAKIHFYFYTSRRYNEKNIPLSIKLKQTRPNLSNIADLGLKTGERTKNIVDVRINKIETQDGEPGEMRRIDEIIKPSDVDKNIPYSRTDGSNTLAVIIGVENYKYAPRVDYASRDAQIFYKYAQQVFGIPEKNIFYRINEGATSGEFKKVFSEEGWLARRVQPEKTHVIVYYAGHGAPELKTKTAYLIPYDIDPNYASTGYQLGDMYKALGNLKAKSVTVFLDACFSGISRSNEMLIAGARSIIIKPKKSDIYGENTAVITASTNDQYSASYPDKYHGLFTYYLLKGIGGEAKGTDNMITVQELYNYVSENVSRKAGELDKIQQPTIDAKNQDRVIIIY